MYKSLEGGVDAKPQSAADPYQPNELKWAAASNDFKFKAGG